jgi:hypothetical protein
MYAETINFHTYTWRYKMEKTCNTCRKALPLTEDYFRWYAVSGTYDNKCINCKINSRVTTSIAPVIAPETIPIITPEIIPIIAPEIMPIITPETTPTIVPETIPIKKPLKILVKETIIPINSIEKLLLIRYKRMREKHKDRNFTGEIIDFYEFIDLYVQTQGKCHYTGLEFSLTERGPLLMTVDRIDSTRGYTQGNICFCCWFVNLAKNIWPLETIVPLWAHLPKQIN